MGSSGIKQLHGHNESMARIKELSLSCISCSNKLCPPVDQVHALKAQQKLLCYLWLFDCQACASRHGIGQLGAQLFFSARVTVCYFCLCIICNVQPSGNTDFAV